MNRKKSLTIAINYIVLTVVGYIMIYPLFWLFFSTFKTNAEIFEKKSLLPSSFSLDAYVNGWRSIGKITYTTFYINSFSIVLPVVLLTVISSVFIGYGFARFDFKLRKLFFTIMLATMMLPASVTIVPQYLMFRNFGWINTYKMFIIPTLFGSPFFIFLMIQFMRSIPKELDEAAYIDGYGSLSILLRIFVPLCMPAIFTIIVFQFLWTWNDFFGPLIYINSVNKYTVALGLRLSNDPYANFNWPNLMAMSLVSIIPCILLFFFAQKYFIEGIATTGLKG